MRGYRPAARRLKEKGSTRTAVVLRWMHAAGVIVRHAITRTVRTRSPSPHPAHSLGADGLRRSATVPPPRCSVHSTRNQTACHGAGATAQETEMQSISRLNAVRVNLLHKVVDRSELELVTVAQWYSTPHTMHNRPMSSQHTIHMRHQPYSSLGNSASCILVCSSSYQLIALRMCTSTSRALWLLRI